MLLRSPTSMCLAVLSPASFLHRDTGQWDPVRQQSGKFLAPLIQSRLWKGAHGRGSPSARLGLLAVLHECCEDSLPRSSVECARLLPQHPSSFQALMKPSSGSQRESHERFVASDLLPCQYGNEDAELPALPPPLSGFYITVFLIASVTGDLGLRRFGSKQPGRMGSAGTTW